MKAYPKFGFHLGPGGNALGHGDFLRALDAAGIPFFCKSADAYPFDAAQIAKASNVPHTVVFRRSVPYEGAQPIPNPDVPDYSLPPREAAVKHWEWHRQGLPPELDPAITWVESVNEVDKGRSEWVAEFAIETAKLTLADGYKWAAFGWSTGEPEPEHWQGPKMRQFLQLCEVYPDRLAVALHEYSLGLMDMAVDGWLIGRFARLFEVARPTVLITEFGWTHVEVPEPAVAMAQLAAVAEYYARFPQVKGAAIWYLGPGWQGIANKAQRLITPLMDFALNTVYDVAEDEPMETVPYIVVVDLLPQNATMAEKWQVLQVAHESKRTILQSADDAARLVAPGKPGSKVVVWAPERWTGGNIEEWLKAKGVALVETRPF